MEPWIGAPLQGPIADLGGAVSWLFTNVYARIAVVAAGAAFVPAFLRLHCRPDKNPWVRSGWGRADRFWAVDFAIAAWITFFAYVGESIKRKESVPTSGWLVFVLLTLTSTLLPMFMEKNGWDYVPGHEPVLRRWQGVIVPNMWGFGAVAAAVFQLSALHH